MAFVTLIRTLVPPEIRQTLIDRRRAQICFTLRLTAELFVILERFKSEGIGALGWFKRAGYSRSRPTATRRCAATATLDLLVPQRDNSPGHGIDDHDGLSTPAVSISND